MNSIEKDKLFYRFMKGESIQSIADAVGLSWAKTYKIIDGRLPTVKELSCTEKDEIRDMYINGISCPKISEKFKISHKLVGKVLDEYGIDRKYNGLRKHSLNEGYFDIIDTPNKAYILGLLYADGYNGIDKSTVRLQLVEDDVDILNRINKEIGSSKPLKYLDCSNRIYGNGYISKNMYVLEFYGTHICKSLDNNGMHQNKSLILTYPEFLREDLYSHFIRGYFDGDGSVYQNPITGSVTITITSTEQFCNTCLDILRRNLSIGGGIYDASNHNGITKVLSICGDQCKTVLEWLYQDAEMYIQRKYDRYIQYYCATAA